MGPKAIGNHVEWVAENFLRAHGIAPIAQYPYRDERGLSHFADFYDSRPRTAYEVKTGRSRASSRNDFRVEHLHHAVKSGQFAQAMFLNVGFLGHVGFADSILKLVRGFRATTLDWPFINGTGYRTPSTKPRRLASLSALLRLAEKHEPGPSPGFSRAHALLAFITIGASGTIGRQTLAQNSGLGEGSVRTVLKKFRQEGYVDVDTLGCHLTDSGRDVYQTILRRVTPLVSLHDSQLTVGGSQIAVLARSSAVSVASGIEQRDAAIRVGATGATTYIIKGRRFAIPGGSSDCEKDFPSESWARLKEKLAPVNGDAIIVCGARDETTAKVGAISAALTLI